MFLFRFVSFVFGGIFKVLFLVFAGFALIDYSTTAEIDLQKYVSVAATEMSEQVRFERLGKALDRQIFLLAKATERKEN